MMLICDPFAGTLATSAGEGNGTVVVFVIPMSSLSGAFDLANNHQYSLHKTGDTDCFCLHKKSRRFFSARPIEVFRRFLQNQPSGHLLQSGHYRFAIESNLLYFKASSQSHNAIPTNLSLQTRVAYLQCMFYTIGWILNSAVYLQYG